MTAQELFGKKKKWYAYFVPGGASGVSDDWKKTEKQVSGKAGARYRSFKTREEAEAWLKTGADYGPKYKAWLEYSKTDAYKKTEAEKEEAKRAKRAASEKGIYFDAGTGRGEGVEISVTDEKGKNLLHEAISKTELNKFGKHLVGSPEATNNYGELLALRYALTIAIDRREKNIFGDSKLVIDYWSKWRVRRKEIPEETVRLAHEVSELREEFEKMGGEVLRISGDYNPADLGFHK